MFQTLLIANRGEIACRVARTALKMGIRPIAVYSDADREAKHVRFIAESGGETVRIGPAPSAESYLSIDAILAACRQTGAEAVHPGYGFLSENRAFAKALADEKITFLGPPESAIEAMGDKIRSKILAAEAGVSIVPGHDQAVSDPEEAVKIAQGIGYPVMLKASAGGGGKGMRLAYSDEECREGLVAAMNEGKASFGDERVFIEKFIEQPRHIEIQILADSHGNVVSLGERECSLQRRHQKVIEEAPSPFISAETRKAMGRQAVELARRVNYQSAGTVEFIVDSGQNFYFLEMNTRLQVEHPVTEYVTGLDLVEWMIRIGAGEALSFTEADIQANKQGWAVEARFYAEDPTRGFLPAIGRITRYQEPEGEGIRVDSGCLEGGEISMYYDPMIAKLIACGDTRVQAIDRLAHALDEYCLEGPAHNRLFLSHLVNQPAFRSGDMSTATIGDIYPDGLTPAHLTPEDPALFALVAVLCHHQVETRAYGGGTLPDQEFCAFFEENLQATVSCDGVIAHVTVADKTSHYDHLSLHWKPGDPLCRLTVGAEKTLYVFQVTLREGRFCLSHHGAQASIKVMANRLAPYYDKMPEKAAPDLSRYLLSPMPGLLRTLLVSEGDSVSPDQPLAVIEAMKMENTLRATQAGQIESLNASPGDTLAADQPILTFVAS